MHFRTHLTIQFFSISNLQLIDHFLFQRQRTPSLCRRVWRNPTLQYSMLYITCLTTFIQIFRAWKTYFVVGKCDIILYKKLIHSWFAFFFAMKLLVHLDPITALRTQPDNTRRHSHYFNIKIMQHKTSSTLFQRQNYATQDVIPITSTSKLYLVSAGKDSFS